MLDAGTVRLIAVVISIATIAGVVLFRRKAHVCAGRHPEFRAEANPPRALQVLWPVLVLVPQAYPFAVAIAPDLAYLAAPRFDLPFAHGFQLLGFIAWGVGGLLVLWSGRTLGRFMVLQIGVARDHELVTAGPYAVIRHPTYAGTMIMSSGLTLLFLSVGLLLVTFLVVLVASYRALKEERLLASGEGFGEAYRAYIARTGRFLPRFVRARR